FPIPPPHRCLHSFPTRRSSDLLRAKPKPSDTDDDQKDRHTKTEYQHSQEIHGDSPGLLAAFLSSLSFRLGLPDVDGVSVDWASRSEEHTSELQSRGHLVCRLLL